MLEQLDRVPWSSLHDVYGPATEIPRILRDLTSVDPALREQAWVDVFSHLLHQGDVAEASAHAVPFLLEMVQSPTMPQRDWLLGFLGDCARAERLPGAVEKTHAAVRAGREVYETLLLDPDPMVRAGAVFVVAALPETESRVLAAAHAEQHPLARAGMVLILGQQQPLTPETRRFLEASLRDAKDARERLAAAAALATALGPKLPGDARELLEEADPLEAYEALTGLPWDAGLDVAEVLDQI